MALNGDASEGLDAVLAVLGDMSDVDLRLPFQLSGASNRKPDGPPALKKGTTVLSL